MTAPNACPCGEAALYFGPFGNACQGCALRLVDFRDSVHVAAERLEADHMEALVEYVERRREDLRRCALGSVLEGVRRVRLHRMLAGQPPVMP